MKRLTHLLLALGFALTLPACSQSMYTAGTLTPTRAQVAEEQYYHKIHTSELAGLNRHALIDHHAEYGEGAAHIIGFYDPKAGNQKEVRAKVNCLSNSFRKAGADVYNELLPLSGQSNLAVSYNYVTAKGPRDCTTMAGYAHTDIGNNGDYRMGCTVETLIARQVSNPRDLLGQEHDDVLSDGRSAASIVNTYRQGAQNEPLGGFQASDE